EAGAHRCLVLPIHAGQVASMLADARRVNSAGRHRPPQDLPSGRTFEGVATSSPGVEAERAARFQPAAVPAPASAHALPWHQAQEFLREIEAHLKLLPGNGQAGKSPLRLLVERMPDTLE